MAGVSPDDIEASLGENTIEGDLENDVNAAGGIDKDVARTGPIAEAGENRKDKMKMQGRKTHEQQVRILERKSDVPDARQVEQAFGHNPEDATVRRLKPEARQSEFPVSRGGLNQESDHNKHNDPGQVGHKPPKPMRAQEKH
jgi:hypothetical protein